MLLAAARRFAALFAFAAAVTLTGSALLGLLAGSPIRRALALGLYLVGSVLLIAGFFVGNRGRVRTDSDTLERGPFAFFGARTLRRASEEEERESISTSAIFIALGVALLLLAVAVDARHELV